MNEKIINILLIAILSIIFIGYKDPLLFSKNFTKHFEISASEYRRQFANQ
ncbi:AraC-like DNA-binding protein [Staphylococcus epidermidis]|nr:hypothetical protein [Staphylococcus epidermidis]